MKLTKHRRSARPSVVNPRAAAARIVADVVAHGYRLDTALAEHPASGPREAALVQEMSYGTLRWYDRLAAIAALFLDKPLKPKDQDIHTLLLVGLYQLHFMRVARHAAVKETVAAARALKKIWAKDLLNACLRSALREEARVTAAVAADPTAAYSHPQWLLEEIKQCWLDDWTLILTANNERPPLTLRVNVKRQTRTDYLERLAQAKIAVRAHPRCETAVVVDPPVPVSALPGFAEGAVSVQDAAAQFAAPLLDTRPGDRVLDACAAPGGKLGHLLEHVDKLAGVVALERDPTRAALIEENLVRLGLSADVITGDAAQPSQWWHGPAFDRILVDAPCSATGVIRRHPDIKRRRRPEDLPRLAGLQQQILEGLWPWLKPGGKLLYVTCSILPVENENQMTAFLARHPEAQEEILPLPAGRARSVGRQILPGESGMDGFYYARLRKN